MLVFRMLFLDGLGMIVSNEIKEMLWMTAVRSRIDFVAQGLLVVHDNK